MKLREAFKELGWTMFKDGCGVIQHVALLEMNEKNSEWLNSECQISGNTIIDCKGCVLIRIVTVDDLVNDPDFHKLSDKAQEEIVHWVYNRYTMRSIYNNYFGEISKFCKKYL